MSFDGAATPALSVGGDIDHRKKRRNRTTHSCINCHTTKRKCDRKRPCGRCTQLGLTGLCVYEVDDPATADDPNIDETSKLRKRIAELEGVIRELKNKPHPKWASTAQAGGADLSFHTRSAHAKRRRLSDSDEDDFDGGEAGPSGIVKLEHSYADIDARYTLSDSFRLPSEGPVACECLTSQSAFSSLTELDSYLRAAINLLGSLRHTPLDASPISPGSPHERCALFAEIVRLQNLISQSTRAVPALAPLPTIRPPSPSLHQQHHHQQNRGPLSVQVPMSYHHDSVPNGATNFSLRPPPPTPPSQYGHHQGSYSHHNSFSTQGSFSAPLSGGCCDNGLITPPLSSISNACHPWDGMSGPASAAGSTPSPLLPSSHAPRPMVSSPALSHSSDTSRSSSGTYSHGSGSSAGPLPSLNIPVPDCLERDAVTSLVGMFAAHNHQQQHHQPPPQFFPPGPPTTSSVPFDYELAAQAQSSMGAPPPAFDFGTMQFPMRAAAY